MQVPAVANPPISQKLLSVHSLTKHYGPVLFPRRNASMFDTNRRHRPELITTAPWNSSLRAYSLINRTPLSARGARTYKKAESKHSPPTPPNRTTTTTPPNRLPPTISSLPSIPHSNKATRSNILTQSNQPTQRKSAATHPAAYNAWHLILNHAPPRNLQQMALQKTIPVLPPELRFKPPAITCASCAHATLLPAPHKTKKMHYPVGAYISSDTCGPIKPLSRQGNQHFLTFIDAQSRYLILYFLKDSREVRLVIPALFALLTAHSGRPPKVYRTDNEKEFCSTASTAIYRQYGTEHRTTTPHQPQENSRAERIKMALMNMNSTRHAQPCASRHALLGGCGT